MSVIRIASRYAKSLLELATEQGQLETVMSDIQGFQAALTNRDLEMMVKSPIINADKKKDIFEAIFGDKIDELTAAFFNIIIRKGREQYLPEIAKAFISQYKELKNITTATVTTATPITDPQIDTIKEQIRSKGLANGEIELDSKIDASIKGGFILEINDQLYDASVKSKLAEVKKQILDNTYIKSL